MFRAFPVPVGLVCRCTFGQLRRQEVEVVRTSLGVHRKEVVGLRFSRVVEGDARGHVDEEDGGRCQCGKRNSSVSGFGFGDLGTRDCVELGEGMAAGYQAFCDPEHAVRLGLRGHGGRDGDNQNR